jgi:DNA helicase IV
MGEWTDGSDRHGATRERTEGTTASTEDATTQQTAVEQAAVDEMYAHLDADLQARTDAKQRALRRRTDGPTEAYARDVAVHRADEEIRRLQAAERALCFGRIDRATDPAATTDVIDGTDARNTSDGAGADGATADGADARSLSIGRIGMRDAAGDVLLVDWRAEAARPFYAATPASPMGVRRRRHLRMEGRRVEGVSDEILDGSEAGPDDVVGDGPLAEALSGARTGRMHEAASTLQAEQDEIVRSPHRGITVVDGGPGTGKTIVALHRAAYVLYAWPQIAGRGVLVHGPNQRFLTYISDVLPSLGENDVQLATLPDLVGTRAQRTEPDRIARAKGRDQLADALADWVRDHEPGTAPLELLDGDDAVVLDAAVVDMARRQASQGGAGHNDARALFTEYVVDDLVSELEARTAQEDSDFESELAERFGIDLDQAVAGDLDDAEPEDGEDPDRPLSIDWDRIREELVEDPSVEESIERVWPQLEAGDVVRGVLTDRAVSSVLFPELGDEDLKAVADGVVAGWTHADLALLDEARALVDGGPDRVYGHVVIDEAQQLTAMQWRVLMRRCPERSMTVVGDLAQAGPTTTMRSWQDALAPFVEDRWAHRTLTINYRTTAEILESTRSLLGRIAPEQQLSRSIRHGEEPRTIAASRPGDAVQADDEQAEDAAGHDPVTGSLRAVVDEARTAHPGELIGVVTTADAAPALESAIGADDVTVVGAPDVRGLEFDTVILVDPDGMEAAGDAGLRDLYVAMTRATQRLITLATGDRRR